MTRYNWPLLLALTACAAFWLVVVLMAVVILVVNR